MKKRDGFIAKDTGGIYDERPQSLFSVAYQKSVFEVMNRATCVKNKRGKIG